MKQWFLGYSASFGAGDSSDDMEWECNLTDEQEAIIKQAIREKKSLNDIEALQELVKGEWDAIYDSAVADLTADGAMYCDETDYDDYDDEEDEDGEDDEEYEEEEDGEDDEEYEEEEYDPFENGVTLNVWIKEPDEVNYGFLQEFMDDEDLPDD